MAFRQNSSRLKSNRYSYVVSACLAGVDCSYNGTNRLNTRIADMVRAGIAIAVCPEVMGGSPIPRERCEILSGDGCDVLGGRVPVRTVSGRDVTRIMVHGARLTLALAKSFGIKRAVLKSNSPSCGRGAIYDGTFKGRITKGNGVTAELLLENNIRVFTEKERRKWSVRSIS